MTDAIAAIPHSNCNQLAQESVRRDAFYIDGGQRPFFSWLHHQPQCNFSSHGIVICPPLGFEQLHAHRGLRHLADRIARLGMPVLRFDWDGTGDSPGCDLDPDRLATWCENVRSAVRWLKESRGCQRVSVVGLRMGATLAALSLQDEDIENLVLWASITTGRSFVREQNVIDMLSETQSRELDAPGMVDAAGFRFTQQTAADLSKCTLLQSRPRCQRILLVNRDNAAHDVRVVVHFQSLKTSLEQRVLPGVAEMLLEPHKSIVATQAIDGIVDWLSDKIDRGERSEEPAPDQVAPGSTTVDLPGSDGVSVRETLFRIETSPDLFGIVSEPANGAPPELPVVVLLNAGAAYRIGPGRMTTEMAREFSSMGFRCLRLDVCGLGDSVTDDPARENDSYSSTAFRDVQIALQQLRDRFGSRRFVLMGLCSGAYVAFQSAAQFADPGLIESILINPLTFYWSDGMSLETAPTTELIREHYYLTSALQPAKWLKLLSGRSHIGIGGALRLVGRRMRFNRRSRHVTAVEDCGAGQTNGPSHPLTNDLTGDLRRIAASGRHLSMYFSTTDPGYSILTSQAGRQTRRMIRNGQLKTTFIENADHTFSRQVARRKLIQAMSAHLRQRYLVRKP